VILSSKGERKEDPIPGFVDFASTLSTCMTVLQA
jgi:hypothetical protein